MNTYSGTIELKNGIFIGLKHGKFDLCFGRGMIIISDCDNFSYISEKIITVKKRNKIFIFDFVTTEENGHETLKKLAEFKAYDSKAEVKISLGNHFYFIDMNCQVRISDKIKNY